MAVPEVDSVPAVGVIRVQSPGFQCGIATQRQGWPERCFRLSRLAIVVHKRATVGNNVVISPNVTIGGLSAHFDVPIIGNDVVIGAGARILGPVKIGDGARIGANAVVLDDVPAGGVAVGIPARVVRINPREERG